jgi:uncharacterized protein with GYD domain
MQTYILMTRLAPASLDSPKALEVIERQVMDRVRSECPEVEWLSSFAILGPWDYMDIFRADDIATATKISTLVRTFGHAHTEVWAATEWKHFKELMRDLPAAA